MRMKNMVLMSKSLALSYSRCFPSRISRTSAVTVVLLLTYALPIRAQGVNLYELIESCSELRAQGEYRKALDDLTKAVPEDSQYVPNNVLDLRADLYFEVGDVDKAIADMEEVIRFTSEPAYLLKLAELYRYRGRMKEYNDALDWASQMERIRVRESSLDKNLLALGRIAELRGTDPKRILSLHYGAFFENRPDYAPAQVAAGDLAYSKGSYNLASKYYMKAIGLDVADQDAMAGLAECYWKSDDQRCEDVVRTLLGINPNHPRANAILVEKLLDGGKTGEAMKTIDKMLDLNPNRLRFRALKSAALFLDDDLDAMELVQKKTLEFNPACSEVYRIPGRIASRHYRFEEGVAFQRRALELDPDDHQAAALLAYDLLRLGIEEEGRQKLDQAFKADPYNVHVFNMLEVMDKLGQFATVKRGPFILQLPANEAPVIADDALDMLTEALDQLQREYKTDVGSPINVQMFDNHDDFMVRSIGLPGNIGHLGICFGPLVTMDSPSVRKKESGNWRSVLWHEFAHVITLHKTKHRMPRWLSEGISVYEEIKHAPAWGQTMEAGYKVHVAHEPMPGLSDLETFFTQPKSPGHLQFGYFLAGEFVKSYVDAFQFDSLVDTLDRIGQGEPTLKALASSAGVSQRKVDAAFKSHLKQRLAPYDNLPEPPKPEDPSTEEPRHPFTIQGGHPLFKDTDAPFTKAMRNAAQAVEAKRWDVAEQEFKRAHELFPEYAGQDGPLPGLVKVYERLGKKEELKQTLNTMLKFDAADFGTCQKLAAIYREENDWTKVMDMGRLGMGIDPFDISMRKDLVEAYRETGHDAHALDTLAILAHLDPVHGADYALQRAELFKKTGQWESAKKEVITVLEETPHCWKAQQMLLAIVERDKGTQ
jgi:tetratricopeptide (TPR) repeat protein